MSDTEHFARVKAIRPEPWMGRAQKLENLELVRVAAGGSDA
jgi:hypothetical protein